MKMRLVYRNWIYLILWTFLAGCGSPAVTTLPAVPIVAPPTETILPTVDTVTSPTPKAENVAKIPTPTHLKARVTSTVEQNKIAATTFSIESLNPQAPAGIMKEFAYFLGGGGGYNNECDSAPANQLSFLFETETPTGLYDLIAVGTCGWQTEERVRATVQSPDGSMRTEEYQTDGTFLWYGLQPLLKDVPGTYHLTLEGESGVLQADYEKVEPDQPGTYQLETGPESGMILYYGLAPSEKVSLFVYDSGDCLQFCGEFIGWKQLQADSSGKLLVGADRPDPERNLVYIAIGESTGTLPVQVGEEGIAYLEIDRCADLTSRLQIRSRARVITKLIYYLEGETFLPSQVETLAVKPGDLMTIIDGPACMDGLKLFWKVEFDDGLAGWVSEASSTNPESGEFLDFPYYFLEPAEGSNLSQAGNCPGAPLSRINTGGSAYVCTQVDALNLRDGPGSQGNQLDKLTHGTNIIIIDGPVCADGQTWWKIETGGYITGWVAEGGDEEDPYFICPAP